MLALPVGETIGPVTIPVGAIAGAIKGAAVGFAAGAALDGVVQMANAGRGRRGGNRVPNSQVKRLYKKYDLNNAGQDYVHDIISPEGMSIEEIEEVVKEAATHDKFPKNPPAPPE